ncbi:MAG: hypothetical protein KJS79_10045 [Rhodospirillales bacterium]|nr:hypothetical protein [Rhodospirillales bacterium]
MSDRENGFDDPVEDRDQPERPVKSSRYSEDQIDDMRDVASALGLDLSFDPPAGEEGEISDSDRAVWSGPGRPPWRGPGPNFLAEMRGPMTSEQYDAHLDEMAAALRAAISAAWDREAKRQKRKKRRRRCK